MGGGFVQWSAVSRLRIGGSVLLLLVQACAGTLGPAALGGEGADAGVVDASADAAAADAGPTDAKAPEDAQPSPSPEPPPRAWAAWPVPNLPGSGLAPAQAYEVEGDLVTDLVTGLVWANAYSDTMMNQADAQEACEQLELGGRQDYRLPTRIEWASIVDPNRTPTLPPELDEGVAEYHWTASVPSSDPSLAYSVYLGTGQTTLGVAERPTALSRCVAGGPEAKGRPSFELQGPVARDPQTGLSWTRTPVSGGDWDAARAACTDVGGRLPSLRELQSLVDEGASAPLVDANAFPAVEAAPHWTATRPADSLYEVWMVDLATANTDLVGINEVYPALCVVE